MALFLLSYLALAYIFSGLVCWLAFLSNFNQQSLLSWRQYLLAGLASFVIVIFWPIWIMIDIRNTERLQPKDELASLSRFIIISGNTLQNEELSNEFKP